MSRLNTPDPAALSAEQRSVYEAIRKSRKGSVEGPFGPWLYSPEFADRAQKLGEFCRYHTSLPPRLSELAILVTARWWRAGAEWQIHAPVALEAGISKDVLSKLQAGEKPDFLQHDEALVYEFTMELYDRRRVSAETYRRTVALLSDTGTVELVGILGYYALVAMTLNAFEVALPEAIDSPFME